MRSPLPPDSPEALLFRWVESFNSRDLGGMLACMDADVRFHPLRLHGLERSYRGHEGVRRWYEHLEELGHDHLIALSEVRGGSDGEALAVGRLQLTEQSDPVRFWALHRVDRGRIIAAHHYLTDPDVLRGLDQPRRGRGRPPRFPGLRGGD